MCIKKEISLRVAQLEFTAARLKRSYASKELESALKLVDEDSKAILEKWNSIKETADDTELEEFLVEISNELLLTQEELEGANSVLESPNGFS